MTTLLAVLLGIGLSVLGRETWGWLPHVSRGLIWIHTVPLPAPRCSLRREEWYAELATEYEDRRVTGCLWALSLGRISAWERLTTPIHLGRYVRPSLSAAWQAAGALVLVIQWADTEGRKSFGGYGGIPVAVGIGVGIAASDAFPYLTEGYLASLVIASTFAVEWLYRCWRYLIGRPVADEPWTRGEEGRGPRLEKRHFADSTTLALQGSSISPEHRPARPNRGQGHEDAGPNAI